MKTSKIVKIIIACNAIFFGSIIIATALILTFAYQRSRIATHYMENSLFYGENVLVDKLTYRSDNPKRFDIVIYTHYFESGKKTYSISRIIGLPGETVQIDNGLIQINDEKLIENYGKEEIQESGIAASGVELGENEYFVLGDNRNNSIDSRASSVGAVKRKEIIGRVRIRIFPFDRVGAID